MSTPLWPEELVSTGTERDVLEAFLDCQRRQIVAKVAGVPEEAARRRIVPSKTTLAGLVKHLTAVERNWFHRQLAQRDPADIPGNSRGDDESWEPGPDDTLDGLVAEYERVCQESRRIAAGFALDDTVPSKRLGEVSLRWIYAHMIEETAQHAGHADILRELTDGATGL
ncbi:DinB family protein [Nonomuraea aridisoli]|uniref:Mini-circle protein n=1 Tax=Nonomuraea aridisoli TaxID=2070368 RepID=A0A2W2EP68_9ACTN|nr:DinB family protein [Nonomuraea aridisoli]PZG18385.1 mini-circle protein [Nonomuraea aridisoli]